VLPCMLSARLNVCIKASGVGAGPRSGSGGLRRTDQSRCSASSRALNVKWISNIMTVMV
jgi:hypothetical protein